MLLLQQLSASDWAIGLLAAVFVGLGKGGLPGAGNLAIILMIAIFPSKESVGILLPVLICADIVAVSVYHRHTRWPHLFKLLPWTLVGVGVGALVFRSIDDAFLTRMIGAILLLMVALRPVSRRFQSDDENPAEKTPLPTQLFIVFTGVLGGVATMVANAAGPVIGIYLLVSGLPKYAFLGTAAWFFFVINLSKMPVQIGIGNITWQSLSVSLCFGAMAALAASLAPRIVHYIPQKMFSFLIWMLIIVSGVKMLLL